MLGNLLRRTESIGGLNNPSTQLYQALVGMDGGATYAGPIVNADTATRISTVYSCVTLIAQTIAALPPEPKGDNPGARLVAHFARTELNGKIPDESTRTALWTRATAVVMGLPPMPPAVHTYFSRAA